jgi:carbamate kinase
MLAPAKGTLLAYVNVTLPHLENPNPCPSKQAKCQSLPGGFCTMSKLAVYALGGNALEAPGGHASDALEVLARVMSDIVDLLEMDWRVVITHGNGPQVGHLLGLDADGAMGMERWVAATQGMIGHQLSLQLQTILHRRRRPERTAMVLTHVEVDPEDEGFTWPTKPVGPVLDAQTVMSADWDIAQTVHGPRRVVASPAPLRVMELDVIRQLVDLQGVVICGGGGGVPVLHREEGLQGVAGVIDKDLLSSLLASDLEADALIISTGVDAIYSDFGTPQASLHRRLSVDELKSMQQAGHFPAGSMGPKVSALSAYCVSSPEGRAVLCQPGDVLAALRGERGTTVRA